MHASPLIINSGDGESSFSSWDREEDALTNGDFLYKCPLPKGNYYSVFIDSPVFVVSQK